VKQILLIQVGADYEIGRAKRSGGGLGKKRNFLESHQGEPPMDISQISGEGPGETRESKGQRRGIQVLIRMGGGEGKLRPARRHQHIIIHWQKVKAEGGMLLKRKRQEGEQTIGLCSKRREKKTPRLSFLSSPGSTEHIVAFRGYRKGKG